MATGLLALLDDVAAIARVAATSLDDVTAQAARAGAKAAGMVIDDAAVTPRYVHGFAPARELPIVGRIAMGSVRNKLLLLLPVALVLSELAPGAIMPLLMLGGLYLCYEGAEKVRHVLAPAPAHVPAAAGAQGQSQGADGALRLEEARVRGAIQTDFILSAEIMAVSLSTLPEMGLGARALVLALVGLALTALVYGGVGLLVKLDDIGLALARNPRPATSLLGLRTPPPGEPSAADRRLRGPALAVGRVLVRAMPRLMAVLSVVGTAAMLWVGGGIVLHGLESLGWSQPLHLLEAASEGAGSLWPARWGATGRAVLAWAATALGSGLAGLVLGLLLLPVAAGAGRVAGVLGRLRPGR